MAQQHGRTRVRPVNVQVAPGSQAELIYYARASLPPEAIAPGVKPKPSHDLTFHGGKTIANLNYFTFYVSDTWQASDRQNIDTALGAVMSDRRLNNVMGQYFQGPITTSFKGSTVLAGPAPQVQSQGDIEQRVQDLFNAGQLNGHDLTSTVFCIMLPPGTVLNDDAAPTSAGAPLLAAAKRQAHHRGNGGFATRVPGEDDKADSLNGLGGYHGSVHVGANIIYYAVGVYSDVQTIDGVSQANGIPVFPEPWKNVVATFYHELNEARTDADVEDAIKRGNDPTAVSLLGWTSRKGEECGDFPVFEARPLTQVFQEVPLATGGSTAPVQFMYSDAVHGPEGPIDAPDPFAGKRATRVAAAAGAGVRKSTK